MLMVVCRTPPGVRELKLTIGQLNILGVGRTPPGVRELKLLLLRVLDPSEASHPSRGA